MQYVVLELDAECPDSWDDEVGADAVTIVCVLSLRPTVLFSLEHQDDIIIIIIIIAMTASDDHPVM